MNVRDLSIYADRFLQNHFNMSLGIPVRVSKRMTSKLGAFKIQYQRHTPVHLEIVISHNFLMHNSLDTVLDVLYHECVHYALFTLGKPYRDGDAYFIQTLNKLGISKTRTYQYKGTTHLYTCAKCSYQFTKNIKGYQKRYRCRYCRGHFLYKGTIQRRHETL